MSKAQAQERSYPFMLVSLILHAAVICLIPLAGFPQLGRPDGTGGPIELTVLNVQPAAKGSVGAVIQPEPIAVPKPQAQPVAPPVVAKPEQTASRVLTVPEPEQPARNETEEGSIPIVPEAPVQEPVAEPVGNGNLPTGPAAFTVPYGGDVVRLLPTNRYPSKDAAGLTASVVLKLLVTVDATGKWVSAETIEPLGFPALARYAENASRFDLRFEDIGRSYEVDITCLIDPNSRKMIWDIPKGLVRLVD